MNQNKYRIVGYVLLLIVFCVHSTAAYSRLQDEDEKRSSREWRKSSFSHHGIGFSPAENNLFHTRSILDAREELALTPEQEKKLQDLSMEHMAVVIRGNGEIKIKELQFTAYLKSGKMERKEVVRFVRGIGEKKADLFIQYVNHLLDVKAVLTPTQLKKMTELYSAKKKIRKRLDRRTSTGDSSIIRD